jgi:hypothetical protein
LIADLYVFVLFQLAEIFEAEIDGVMQSLGYCCGRKYVFSPQVLCCFGKQLCPIPRDTVYYSYQDRLVNSYCFSFEAYVCLACLWSKALSGGIVASMPVFGRLRGFLVSSVVRAFAGRTAF